MGLGKPQGMERQLLGIQDDEGKQKVNQGSILDTNSITWQWNIKGKAQEQPLLRNRENRGNMGKKLKNTAVCRCSSCLAAGVPDLQNIS